MLHGISLEQSPETVTQDRVRWVRAHVAREGFDPWSLLEAPAAADAPIFAWRDGRSGLKLAGVGTLATLSPDGKGRFERAAAWISRWCEQLRDVDVPPFLPLAHAGFGFWDAAPEGEAWRDWSAATLAIPRVLAWSQGGEGGVVVAGALDAGETVGEGAERLRQLARELPRGAGEAAGQGTVTAKRVGIPRQVWCQSVRSATAAIEAGKMDKVVLARAATVQTTATIPALLRDLSEVNEGAYAFCFGSPRLGHFVGATPETLVRVADGQVETVALAGTARRGATPEEDAASGQSLVNSGKDRREHAITLAAIRDALDPVCDTLQIGEEAALVSLPHVHHLETKISGIASAGVGALDLVGRLHPTPAVGGWPRAAALAWLETHEALDRGWYAGPVGWVGRDGAGVFAVAIRSALLRGAGAHVFAGAGIVAGSDPEREWDETALKLMTARDFLGAGEGDS